MSIIYNKGQKETISEAVDFYLNSSEQVFLIDGPAGTGKSTVMFGIAKALNTPLEKIAPMAYMGQAAIVMKLNGFLNAQTMHSWLYRPVDVPKMRNGKPVYDSYLGVQETESGFNKKDIKGYDYMFFDEAWNVPEKHKEDILSQGMKIFACGDEAQLPPVTGKSAFADMGVKVHHLTEIMRQKSYSNILRIADLRRRNQNIPMGYFNDVLIIYEDQITDAMLMNVDMVICGYNKTKEFYNQKIRKLKGFSGNLPNRGEKIICRKNNWKVESHGINLANGLVGKVTNFPGVEGFDGKTFKIDFSPELFPNIKFRELNADYKYLHADAKEKEFIKKCSWMPGDKFDYAHAITCHSSQGSAFNNVLYISEYFSPEIQPHLDYTGITRARENLIYVIKRPKKYFYFNK